MHKFTEIKKYILNIDLSNFFGSIHYGRISSFSNQINILD